MWSFPWINDAGCYVVRELKLTTTGCPTISVKSNTPLFSDICWRSRLSFHVVIGHTGALYFLKKIEIFAPSGSGPGPPENQAEPVYGPDPYDERNSQNFTFSSSKKQMLLYTRSPYAASTTVQEKVCLTFHCNSETPCSSFRTPMCTLRCCLFACLLSTVIQYVPLMAPKFPKGSEYQGTLYTEQNLYYLFTT